jgi:hypothetical protein
MMNAALLRIISAWAVTLSLVSGVEITLQPVLVSTKGKVTVTVPNAPAAPATSHQALPIGSEVITDGGSAALLSVVPGISSIMKEKTTLRVKVAEIKKGSRFGETELVGGIVVCSLKKQGDLKQRYRLIMGPQEYSEAVGTVWQAGVRPEKHSVAVLEGTVRWVCSPLTDEILIPAGSILLSQYEVKGDTATLIAVSVVNLINGTITLYSLDGSAPVTRPATTAELEGARNVFSEAVGNEFENLKTDEKTALLSLLFNANKMLASAGVAAITTPTATGGGAAVKVTSNSPADATSPINP